MCRSNDLNTLLKTEVYNRKCITSNTIPILENCETLFVNCVFEEKHGEKLYLKDVINHLQNLSIERGLEDNEIVKSMIEQLVSFQEYVKNIKKGSKGERFARKSLEKITIPSHIFENIELSFNGVTTEDDFIVVNENGIFVIEVKFCESDMCITNDGFLVPTYNQHASLGSRNILDQVSNERHVVINQLSENLESEDLQTLSKKVHSIVLFANKNKRLYDKSNSTNVLYCHNVASYISSFNNGEKLSQDEIDSIINILKNKEVNIEYDIDFDLDQLRESFIEGICLLENSNIDECEEEQQIETPKSAPITKKKTWKPDWISMAIGSITTGIGVACYKYYINRTA